MTLRTDRYGHQREPRSRGSLVSGLFPTAFPASPVRPWRAAVSRFIAITVVMDLLIATVVVGALTRPEVGSWTALLLGTVAGLGFILAVAVCRGYRTTTAATRGASVQSLLRVAGVLAVLSMLVSYLRVTELPRALVFEALVTTLVITAAARFSARMLVHRLRGRGVFVRRTLVVGPTDNLQHLFDVLDEAQSHGMVVVGICTPTEPLDASHEGRVLGRYDAIPGLLRDLDVDAVIVTADAMDATSLRQLSWQLAAHPVELLVLPSITEVLPRRLHVEAVGGTPLLGVALTTPHVSRWSKAVFDRVVGASLLLAALPVIVTAAGLVRLTSRGPAFFAQTRVGRGGTPFVMHKLRSMYEDAEARLAELHAHNDGNGMLFKMRNDPRITAVGRVLRRYSLDELPQLWNVVKGEMSLVGPRPALPTEAAAFDDYVRHRLHVKPGLTGLWQVSGRSNLSAEESVRLDLRYTDNWSMRMDVAILWRTARAVLGGSGAY